MDDASVARKILEDTIYAVLATASPDGEPWISPVFFAYDEQFNIYWVSNKDARHSRNLRENPRVAITVFNSQAPEGSGDAVYIEARVEELSTPEDVEKGSAVFNTRATQEDFKIKNPSEVTNEGAWRIYRAAPQEVTKLGKGEYISGQYVDMRIPVSLIYGNDS